MGFYSWVTSDTKRSITNIWTKTGTFPVYLLDPHGGPPVEEREYDGYGLIRRVPAYARLWRMNFPDQVSDDETDFKKGLDLAFHQADKIKYPLKFVEDKTLKYEDVEPSQICPKQGFFGL